MDDTITEGPFAGHSAQEVREAQARSVVATSKGVGSVWFGFVMFDPRTGRDVAEYTDEEEENARGWYGIATNLPSAETIGLYRDGELIEVTKNPKWLGEIKEPMTRDDAPAPPVVVVEQPKRKGWGTGLKLGFAAAIAGIGGLVLGGHGKKKMRSRGM